MPPEKRDILNVVKDILDKDNKIKNKAKKTVKKNTADQDFRKNNALKDKLYYIDSEIKIDAKKKVKRYFSILGTTSNIYKVCLQVDKIGCNCPDAIFRKMRCKHIYFVLIKMLKFDDINKESFTAEEFELLLNKKDITNGVTAPADIMLKYKNLKDGTVSVVEIEPKLQDNCCICMDDLLNGETCVHCKYYCGKALHEECFTLFNKNKKDKIKCLNCMHDWNVLPNVTVGKNGDYDNLMMS